jgi:hypothetical protein
MTTPQDSSAARAGDRLEVRSLHGQTSRTCEIVEVLGEPGHVRFRVRWEDDHESIVFPADGVTVVQSEEEQPPG